ncbi:phage tail assembly protein T [Caldanaerobacter sp.]|uniref:phage tail assembly protein T n=1 Tax=Caldanaerobacter sp. TaxID=2930036 RepID=UPI003C759558
MTVKELLSRIDSQELTEWMVYYTLEPWGTEVEDLRTGIVASTIANVNRDPKKQKKPFAPKDFMPIWDKPKQQEQTVEEQKKIIEMWKSILG